MSDSVTTHSCLPSDFEEQYPHKHPQPSGTHQGCCFDWQPDIVVIIEKQRFVRKMNLRDIYHSNKQLGI